MRTRVLFATASLLALTLYRRKPSGTSRGVVAMAAGIDGQRSSSRQSPCP